MKKLLTTTLLLFISIAICFAQANRSTIRFRLSDGDLMRLAVNGRYFNKTGHSLTVSDIPGKRQWIKVYRFRPYANKRGGKATLVYSGKVKIEKGNNYEAIIDVQSGKLYLTEVKQINKQIGKLPKPEANNLLNKSPKNFTEIPLTTKGKATLSPAMKHLKQAMRKDIADPDKLKTANRYLSEIASISSFEVQQICTWILFDDNKIFFAKKAYHKIEDPQNFNIVRHAFNSKKSKQSFDRFLKNH